MHDITFIYTFLCEKQQETDVTFEQLPTIREDAIQRLSILAKGVIAGGGEHLVSKMVQGDKMYGKYEMAKERGRRTDYSAAASFESTRRDIINRLKSNLQEKLADTGVEKDMEFLLPRTWHSRWTNPNHTRSDFIQQFGKKAVRRLANAYDFSDKGLLVAHFSKVKEWALRRKDIISSDTITVFVARLFNAVAGEAIMGVTLDSQIILLYANALAMGPTSMPVECLISSSNKIKASARARLSRATVNDVLMIARNIEKLSQVDFRHIVGYWYSLTVRRFHLAGSSTDKIKQRPELQALWETGETSAAKKQKIRRRRALLYAIDNAKFADKELRDEEYSGDDEDADYIQDTDDEGASASEWDYSSGEDGGDFSGMLDPDESVIEPVFNSNTVRNRTTPNAPQDSPPNAQEHSNGEDSNIKSGKNERRTTTPESPHKRKSSRSRNVDTRERELVKDWKKFFYAEQCCYLEWVKEKLPEQRIAHCSGANDVIKELIDEFGSPPTR